MIHTVIGVCGLSGVQRLVRVVQDVNLRRILAIKGTCASTPKMHGVVLGGVSARGARSSVVRVGVRG